MGQGPKLTQETKYVRKGSLMASADTLRLTVVAQLCLSDQLSVPGTLHTVLVTQGQLDLLEGHTWVPPVHCDHPGLLLLISLP